jgi:hypothetical protein
MYGGSAGLILQDNSGGSNRILLRDSNSIEFEVNGSQRVIMSSTGNLAFNSGYGSVVTAYGVRAWANINQTTDAIRDSGNVSSVSDEGTALYKINFSSSMPDTNYVLLGTASNENNMVGIDGSPPSTYTTSAVEVRIFDASNIGQELTNGILNIAVIR